MTFASTAQQVGDKWVSAEEALVQIHAMKADGFERGGDYQLWIGKNSELPVANASVDYSITDSGMFDIADNQSQTLNLSVTDALEMTDNRNALFIDGDSKDSIELTGFAKVENQNSMNMYEEGYVMYADSASGAHTFVYVSDYVIM